MPTLLSCSPWSGLISRRPASTKARQSGQKAANHQQAPPVADAFQRAGDQPKDQAEVFVGTNVPSHVIQIQNN